MKHLSYLLFIVIASFGCSKSDQTNEQTKIDKALNAAIVEKSGKVLDYFKSADNFNQIIAESVLKTFGQSLPYELDQVDNIEANDKLYSTVTYNTAKGKSTFMVEVNLVTMAKKIIDCTGTCDCRERLTISPNGTETYECTCSSCKMEVTNVQSL